MNGARRPRLAVVGCGDVALRRYLPTLASMAASAELVACCDADADRARAAVAAGAGWAPRARAARRVSEVARSERLDGALNLTPPSAHADVTAECLEAGLHVYSEKPLATELAAARALVARAAATSRLLLCAPAVMATARFRWLCGLVAAGRPGRITLAAGQLANLGPAAWPAYTGDVGAYYGARVGPLVDQGVYVLHAMVGMLGPARRVQAFAATSLPRRFSAVADHWLVQLDFGGGVLGQLLSSYAVKASRAPLLELHGERGSISISEAPPLTDAGPVDLHLDADWIRDARPPAPPRAADSMIGVGVATSSAAWGVVKHRSLRRTARCTCSRSRASPSVRPHAARRSRWRRHSRGREAACRLGADRHRRDRAVTDGACDRSRRRERIVALVSSSAERAAELAAATNAAHAHTSLEAALDDDAVDAVYVGTTNELHAEQAIACLRAGRHVLCEKALALSLADAEAMIATAAEAGTTLAVNHHLRAAASLQRMRSLVAAGAIGRPRLIRSIHRCHVRPDRRSNWRMTDVTRGAGVILDLTVHTADLVRFVCGLEVTSVCGHADPAGFGQAGIEGAVTGTMRLDGVLASFADAYSPLPALSSIEVHGDDDCLAARGIDADADTYARTVERFVAAVRGDGQPFATGDDGLRSLAVALALRTAVAEGRRVAVDR